MQDDIHFLHFLGVIFVICVLFMLTISHFSNSDSQTPAMEMENKQGPVVDITPWKHAKLLSGLIAFSAIASYVLLAQ